MSNFKLIKKYGRKSFYDPKDLNQPLKYQEKWTILINLISYHNKFFLILKKIYQIPIIKNFLIKQRIFIQISSKIRFDFQKIIISFNKNNLILNSFYYTLDYFNYSILNSEIRLGKLKRFISLFIKSKIERRKKKKTLFIKEQDMFSSKAKNKTNRKEPKKLFPSKIIPTEHLGFDFLDKFITNPKRKNPYVSSKMLFYLEKEFNKILFIKEKIYLFVNMLFHFYKKLKEADLLVKKNYSLCLGHNIYYDLIIKKQCVIKNIVSLYYSIPDKLEQNELMFSFDLSKNLYFKILFQTKVFYFHYQKTYKFYRRFNKKSENFKKINLKYLFKYFTSNIFGRKHLNLKKILGKNNFIIKYLRFKKIILKKNESRLKIFYIYRLCDLTKECFILWNNYIIKKDNLFEIDFGNNKYKISKLKVFKVFFFNQAISKFLFISLYRKIRLYRNKINIKAKKETMLFQKIQELNGMEVDFQVFTEFINKLNKLKNGNI